MGKKPSKKTLKVMVTSTKSCKTAKTENRAYATLLKTLTQRVQKSKSKLSICNAMKVKVTETVKKFRSVSSKFSSSTSLKHSTSTSTSKTTKTGWACPSSHPFAYSGGVNCCSAKVRLQAESCPGTRVKCPSGKSRTQADMCANATSSSSTSSKHSVSASTAGSTKTSTSSYESGSSASVSFTHKVSKKKAAKKEIAKL